MEWIQGSPPQQSLERDLFWINSMDFRPRAYAAVWEGSSEDF